MNICPGSQEKNNHTKFFKGRLIWGYIYRYTPVATPLDITIKSESASFVYQFSIMSPVRKFIVRHFLSAWYCAVRDADLADFVEQSSSARTADKIGYGGRTRQNTSHSVCPVGAASKRERSESDAKTHQAYVSLAIRWLPGTYIWTPLSTHHPLGACGASSLAPICKSWIRHCLRHTVFKIVTFKKCRDL